MRIVFWQNCLSPHQLPYIVRLLDDERVDSVAVVAGEATSKSRKNMGWDVTDFSGLEHCEVYLNPMPQSVEHLLSIRPDDTWHLFSGISGFQFVFNALKRSLKYHLRRGLIMELPNTFWRGHVNAKPLWLHRLRFILKDKKYANSFSKVFAMGQRATNYYNTLCSSWRVYPFAYCTTCCNQGVPIVSGEARFIFVGSLSPRKSPMTIVDAVAQSVNKYLTGGG